MNLPISTSSAAGLVLAGVFGLVFGVLLHKGRVTDYNVIVNLFRLRDWTVLKVMLTAIVVGGIGIASMMNFGWLTEWHVKDTNLLGVLLGGALFGIGMVVYGYCPGTGVAAIAHGSVHALVGFGGMLVGGVLYALSFGWVSEHILNVGAYGKLRLPDIVPFPEFLLWIAIAALALVIFRLLRGRPSPKARAESA